MLYGWETVALTGDRIASGRDGDVEVLLVLLGSYKDGYN